MRHNVSAAEPADNRDWTPDFRRVTPKGSPVLDATLAILSSLGETTASRPNRATLKKTASHTGSTSGRFEPGAERVQVGFPGSRRRQSEPARQEVASWTCVGVDPVACSVVRIGSG
jgi:hypothetical protein